MSGKSTKDKGSVWALTSEYNDYDQHGAYFEAVFSKKPTVEELVEFFTTDDKYKWHVSKDPMSALKFILHVQNGGGRMDNEDSWLRLEEVKLK